MEALLAIAASIIVTIGGLGYHAHTEKVKTQIEHDKYAHVVALNRDTGDAIFTDADGGYWTIKLSRGEAKQLNTEANFILLIGQTSEDSNEDELIAVFDVELLDQNPADVHLGETHRDLLEGEIK